MATWSKEKIVNFIELYRENESLWKIRSKDYSNRVVKEKAYQNLIDFVKEFDQEANKDYIMKKINLRGSFRKELKKVENSKKSGAGLDDVYKSKLWYFDNLLFLKDEDVVRATCSSTLPLEPRTSSQNSVDVVVSRFESPDSFPEVVIDTEDSDCLDGIALEASPGSSADQSLNPKQDTVHGFSRDPRPEDRPRHGLSILATKRAPKRKSEQDGLLAIACDRLLNLQPTQAEDAFDYFGKTMAHKLRNLPREQQIFAEKLCSDVMFEATLGRLSSSSTIFTRPMREPEVLRPSIPVSTEPQSSSFETYRSYDYN